MKPGKYSIRPTENHITDGGVGLMSIKDTVENVRTTGFKWNIDNDLPLSIDGFQSTSNEIVSEVATVEVDKSI